MEQFFVLLFVILVFLISVFLVFGFFTVVCYKVLWITIMWSTDLEHFIDVCLLKNSCNQNQAFSNTMVYCVFMWFQCIDKARDLLDAELTAMAGESYSRAYGVRAYTSVSDWHHKGNMVGKSAGTCRVKVVFRVLYVYI